MALTITTEISTDAGITSTTYVRIVNYSLNKNGFAEFKLQLFKSKEDSLKSTLMPGSIGSIDPCFNKEIGESIVISLMKEVDQVILVKQLVQTEVLEEVQVLGPLDENGNATGVIAQLPRTQITEKEVETTVKRMVPDLSSLKGVDIFTVGYDHLRIKLGELYGIQNIKDC
jgi:hypothetical protein